MCVCTRVCVCAVGIQSWGKNAMFKEDMSSSLQNQEFQAIERGRWACLHFGEKADQILSHVCPDSIFARGSRNCTFSEVRKSFQTPICVVIRHPKPRAAEEEEEEDEEEEEEEEEEENDDNDDDDEEEEINRRRRSNRRKSN